MAVTRKNNATVPVQMEQAWKDRVKAVADHERINDSLAAVIRDCVEVALPGFELELGIRDLDDLTDGEVEALGLSREEAAPAAPQVEDRAKGSFGWVPPTG